MDLRGEGSVQGSGETSVLCCFCFSFVSLALVNGCTMWPQPGALGSVADCRCCYATVGWSVDDANFHHMEAFRATYVSAASRSVSSMSKVCRGRNGREEACCGTSC